MADNNEEGVEGLTEAAVVVAVDVNANSSDNSSSSSTKKSKKNKKDKVDEVPMTETSSPTTAVATPATVVATPPPYPAPDSPTKTESIESWNEIQISSPPISVAATTTVEGDGSNTDAVTVVGETEEATEETAIDETAIAAATTSLKSFQFPAAVSNTFGNAMTGLKSVYGGIVTKLRSPSITSLASGVATTANMDKIVADEVNALCTAGALEGGGPSIDNRVNDLAMGWALDAKVDKQAVTFYRLFVNDTNAENGFVIHCRSATKGRFKVSMFDSIGEIVFQQESCVSFDNTMTSTTAFFTKFDTYSLHNDDINNDNSSSTITAANNTLREFPDLFKGTPSLFRKLDHLNKSKKSLKKGSGTYLLCIYGLNLIGKTDVNVLAVPANNEAKELKVLLNNDIEIIKLKDTLHTLQAEYAVVKTAFEDCLCRMNEEEKSFYTKVQTREEAYRSFILASAKAFSPTETVDSIMNNDDSATTGAGNTATIATSTGGNAVTSPGKKSSSQIGIIIAGTPLEVVASTASTATGWIANKLSLGMGHIQQMVVNSTLPADAGSATPGLTSAGTSAPVPGAVQIPKDALHLVAIEVYNAAYMAHESKVKELSDLQALDREQKRSRAGIYEADKARIVREAALSTERWLESFGLNVDERVKQEQYAKDFAEKLLKERLSTEESKHIESEANALAKYKETVLSITSEINELKVTVDDKLRVKEEFDAKHRALQLIEDRLVLERNAAALADKLANERMDAVKKLAEKDVELQKKTEEAQQWTDRLKSERATVQEVARKEQETKLKQEEEARRLAQSLADERIKLTDVATTATSTDTVDVAATTA